MEFLTYILAQDDADLPQTLSTSYGEEEQSIPREYALKVCNMLMQLGARGVSVMFSSGDSGPGAYCIRNTDNSTFFEASFPAACKLCILTPFPPTHIAQVSMHRCKI